MSTIAHQVAKGIPPQPEKQSREERDRIQADYEQQLKKWEISGDGIEKLTRPAFRELETAIRKISPDWDGELNKLFVEQKAHPSVAGTWKDQMARFISPNPLQVVASKLDRLWGVPEEQIRLEKEFRYITRRHQMTVEDVALFIRERNAIQAQYGQIKIAKNNHFMTHATDDEKLEHMKRMGFRFE